MIQNTNNNLQKAGINVQLCLNAPRGNPECQAPKDSSPQAPAWLSIIAVDKAKQAIPVVFIEDDNLFLVSNPKIVNSIHSLARVVERGHQAQDSGAGRTSDLKLCAGSLKILDDPTCTKITSAISSLQEKLDHDLGWFRILASIDQNASDSWGDTCGWLISFQRAVSEAILFGFIQYLVLSVFVYILIEAVGVSIKLFSPPDIFFEPTPSGEIQLIDPPAFRTL
jgi:hypothetical protein